MGRLRGIATVVLLVGLQLSSFAPPLALGVEGWQSYRSTHLTLFYRDSSLQKQVKAFAQENEDFLQYMLRTFTTTKEIEPVDSYIFSDWTSALRENMQLPEAAVWNVYEEGVFERYSEESLVFRRIVANSVDFLHSSVLNLLRMRLRGQNPHDPALLLLKTKNLDPPEMMMYRPTSQYALATFTSFFSYLLDTYGAGKLQSLLLSLNDANYFFIDRSGGEGRNTALFPQNIASFYGKSLQELSQDWLMVLNGMPGPTLALEPQRYHSALDFVNVVGLRFYQWQDYETFPSLMRDMAQLFYYFDRLDLAKSETLIQQIKQEEAEGAWATGRTTRTIIWVSVGVLVLLVGFIALLLYRDYLRRKKLLAFLNTHPNDQEGFSRFLEEHKLAPRRKKDGE
jgi:hypothetical protein